MIYPTTGHYKGNRNSIPMSSDVKQQEFEFVKQGITMPGKTVEHSKLYLKPKAWELIKETHSIRTRKDGNGGFSEFARIIQEAGGDCTRQYARLIVKRLSGVSGRLLSILVHKVLCVPKSTPEKHYCWCKYFDLESLDGVDFNHPSLNNEKYYGRIPYTSSIGSVAAQHRKDEYEVEEDHSQFWYKQCRKEIPPRSAIKEI